VVKVFNAIIFVLAKVQQENLGFRLFMRCLKNDPKSSIITLCVLVFAWLKP